MDRSRRRPSDIIEDMPWIIISLRRDEGKDKPREINATQIKPGTRGHHTPANAQEWKEKLKKKKVEKEKVDHTKKESMEGARSKVK